MSTRDFVGYGPNPPVVAWPNGAKIAVSVVVNYEEGSEYSILDGDPRGKLRENLHPTSRSKNGTWPTSLFLSTAAESACGEL